MTNYKPWASEILQIGGYIRPIKSGETPVVLYADADPTTTGLSLFGEDGTTYTVTAGKTFKIVGIFVVESTSARTLTIYQSDDVDASTNPVNKFIIRLGKASNTYGVGIPSVPTILASKFINVKTSNVTGTGRILILYGVEE